MSCQFDKSGEHGFDKSIEMVCTMHMPVSNVHYRSPKDAAIARELAALHNTIREERKATASLFKLVGLQPHPEGGSPLLHCLWNFWGPAGAFRPQPFDAGFFFACLWDNPHQRFGGRCPHMRVVVRGRESTVCCVVGKGSTGFHHEACSGLSMQEY
eukprot:scaffold207778_cov17-Tisochrysis_lutea.AAC.1